MLKILYIFLWIIVGVLKSQQHNGKHYRYLPVYQYPVSEYSYNLPSHNLNRAFSSRSSFTNNDNQYSHHQSNQYNRNYQRNLYLEPQHSRYSQDHYSPSNTYTNRRVSEHRQRPSHRAQSARRRQHKSARRRQSSEIYSRSLGAQQAITRNRSVRSHYTPPLIHVADRQQVAAHRVNAPIYFKKVNMFGNVVEGHYVRPGPGQIPYNSRG